jgi:hypothetical protein
MPTPNITFNKKTADADGVDTITMSGIPDGATLKVVYIETGEVLFDEAVGDTAADFTFNDAGSYEATVFVQSFTSDDGYLYDAGNEFTFLLEAI